MPIFQAKNETLIVSKCNVWLIYIAYSALVCSDEMFVWRSLPNTVLLLLFVGFLIPVTEGLLSRKVPIFLGWEWNIECFQM